MKRRNVPGFVFIFGIALLPILPILIKGIPYGPDVGNYYRICLSFAENLRQGNLFPAWAAASFGGAGDLSVRFYPPLTFYVASLFRSVTGDWYTASLLLFTFFSLTGAAGVYFWASSLTRRKWALMTAGIYCFLPFHVAELYTGFMLPQFAAAGFLALSLGCIERICQNRNRTPLYVTGLGAAYGLLILTNLPLTVIGSLSLVFYSGLRMRRSHLTRHLGALAVGAVSGLLASGFFLVKILTETKWLSGDKNNYRAWYDYSQNFLFTPAPQQGSQLWLLNLIAAITLLALLPSSLLLLKQGRRRYAPLVLLAFAALFMSTPLSKPLWLIIPRLAEVQFPWRWLAMVTLVCAVIVGVALPRWLVVARSRSRHRPVALFALGAILIAVSFSWFQLIKGTVFTDRTAFNKSLVGIETTSADQYWLPVWTPEPPSTAQVGTSLSSGQTFSVTEAGAFKLKTLYYPHWHAYMGDESLSVAPAPDGSIVVEAGRSGDIRLEWVEPSAVRAATVLSLIVWGLLLSALAFFSFRRRTTSIKEAPLTQPYR